MGIGAPFVLLAWIVATSGVLAAPLQALKITAKPTKSVISTKLPSALPSKPVSSLSRSGPSRPVSSSAKSTSSAVSASSVASVPSSKPSSVSQSRASSGVSSTGSSRSLSISAVASAKSSTSSAKASSVTSAPSSAVSSAASASSSASSVNASSATSAPLSAVSSAASASSSASSVNASSAASAPSSAVSSAASASSSAIPSDIPALSVCALGSRPSGSSSISPKASASAAVHARRFTLAPRMPANTPADCLTKGQNTTGKQIISLFNKETLGGANLPNPLFPALPTTLQRVATTPDPEHEGSGFDVVAYEFAFAPGAIVAVQSFTDEDPVTDKTKQVPWNVIAMELYKTYKGSAPPTDLKYIARFHIVNDVTVDALKEVYTASGKQADISKQDTDWVAWDPNDACGGTAVPTLLGTDNGAGAGFLLVDYMGTLKKKIKFIHTRHSDGQWGMVIEVMGSSDQSVEGEQGQSTSSGFRTGKIQENAGQSNSAMSQESVPLIVTGVLNGDKVVVVGLATPAALSTTTSRYVVAPSVPTPAAANLNDCWRTAVGSVPEGAGETS
ncbi:hypothetical protein C8R44DRAFT_933767 [Mycena epipterygia]|nr:hypothetical protein C8R44DRAFT_933767 [Mycena epipterygia]